ncbi:MAG TPA: DegQ family serine endoprotease [Steroidobacteraceae bacterium]|nr:DegQ family serine endoprotease [Steroidobacteraceae bacterium]
MGRPQVFAPLVALLLVSAWLGACSRHVPHDVAGPVATAPAPVVQPVSPGTAAAAIRGLPDFTELVAHAGPAVVNVSVVARGRPASFDEDAPDDPLHDFLRRFGAQPHGPQPPARGEGSGFIVAADGYILTNTHVVADASEVTVRLTDRREFMAKVIGADRRTDVAVIKIAAKDLPTVKIGDPSKLRPGEWVVAIGSPFGFDNSVTAGIVSAMSRSLPDGQYTPFIQTDAAVNPGNSGGPLFNMAGEVVGVNSQIYSRTGGFMGISFAIPIDIAMEVKDQLVKTGRVQRGRIGVVIQDVGQQLADSFGLDRPRGALVSQVEAGAPGAKAGIRPGDVILAVNGTPIERSGQLSAAISQLKPGSTAEIEVWRGKGSRKIEVEIAELKEGRSARNAGPDERAGGKLGLSLRPLSPQEKHAAGLDGGLLVEDVEGPALEAGLRPGDVILGANGARVATVDDLQNLVEASKRSIALLVNREGTTIFVPLKVGG